MANWAPKVVAAVKYGDILEGVLIEHPPNDAKEEMRRQLNFVIGILDIGNEYLESIVF